MKVMKRTLMTGARSHHPIQVTDQAKETASGSLGPVPVPSLCTSPPGRSRPKGPDEGLRKRTPAPPPTKRPAARSYTPPQKRDRPGKETASGSLGPVPVPSLCTSPPGRSRPKGPDEGLHQRAPAPPTKDRRPLTPPQRTRPTRQGDCLRQPWAGAVASLCTSPPGRSRPKGPDEGLRKRTPAPPSPKRTVTTSTQPHHPAKTTVRVPPSSAEPETAPVPQHKTPGSLTISLPRSITE